MTDKLPPNLLALFAPRPGLRWVPPADHALEERHTSIIGGVGQFLPKLQQYKEEDVYDPTESWLQRRDRKKQEKKDAIHRLQNEDISEYKPSEDPQVKGDAFKTLFVSRLSYDTEVKDLEREFGRFGPIERIRIVSDTQASEKVSKQKRLKGYAFIVFERERDMKAAYKESDGVRIRDRRVLVDVERGRTVSGWRPMRFGGGLGGRGYTKTMPNKPGGFAGPNFGAPAGPGGFRGGFRGGFGGRGGGFRGGPPRSGGGFGDRGGFGGRGGIGYQSNGYNSGPPPEGAPSGPRGGRGGGGFGGGYGGARAYDDRRGGYDERAGSGSNAEPVRQRERGGGYRDRDRDGGYGGQDGFSRKREYSGDDYDERRSRRRY